MNKDNFILRYDRVKIERNYPGLLIYFDESSGLFEKNPRHLYLLKHNSRFFLAFTHYKPSMLNMWERTKFDEIIYHSYMVGNLWHDIESELFPIINKYLPESHYQNFIIRNSGFSAYLRDKDYYVEEHMEHFGEELSENYGEDLMIFVDKVVCNTIAKSLFPNSLDIVGVEDSHIWGFDLEKDVAKISIIALTECPDELIKNLSLVIDKNDEAFISYIVRMARHCLSEMQYLFDMRGLKSKIFS